MVNPKISRRLLRTTISLIVLTFLIGQTGKGQNIGIGTATPDASARVEIQATDKGILIPRLTTLQRTSIVSPAAGLLVYDTNTQGFWYWDGAGWQSLPTSNNVWSTTGNSGTNPATHFVGTLDNKPLLLKTNSQRVGYLGLATADGNIFFGYQSGGSTTTAFSNVAIGRSALASNTTTSNLVAIGDSALFSNTTGKANVAVGSQALYSNDVGLDNTAIGMQALTSNTFGNWNSASGAFALFSNISGLHNTAHGWAALGGNLTGFNNTAIGSTSMINNDDGSRNTAIGYDALSNNGHGIGNTSVGYGALNLLNPGNDNCALGRETSLGLSGLSNSTVIGARARADCSNCMVLGSINGVNGALADVNVGIGTTSPSSKLEVNGKTQTNQLQVGSGTVMNNIQAGSVAVGSSGSGFVSITLTFPTPFASTPKVIATARNQTGTNFNDTFTVTLRSVTNTSVTLNIQRVDINGSWSQNLLVDWIAIQ